MPPKKNPLTIIYSVLSKKTQWENDQSNKKNKGVDKIFLCQVNNHGKLF